MVKHKATNDNNLINAYFIKKINILPASFLDSPNTLLQESVNKIIGSKFKWLCDGNKLQEKPCLLTSTTMGQVSIHF